MLTLLFVSIATFSLVTPSGNVHAQTDPRCFTKEQCIEARIGQGVGQAEASDGFYTGTDARDVCANEQGFCLPAGHAKTQISFGGVTEFGNVGEFIQIIFQYAIGIAGVLSVVMIIVAGIQWILSAGNSTTIKNAHKRIGQSLIGLLIAVMSFSILNLINPQLLNLRLPQTWMVNRSVIKPVKYCIQLDPDDKVAPITKEGQPPEDAFKHPYKALPAKSPYEKVNPRKDINVSDAKHIETQCAKKYSIQNSQNTCLGYACPAKKFCLDEQGCVSAPPGISGEITHEPGKYIDNDIWLYALCEDDTIKEVAHIDLPEEATQYSVTGNTTDWASECKNTPKGYFMLLEVNDNSTDGSSVDDQWMGGKSFCANQHSSEVSCGIFGENTIDIDEEAANKTSLLEQYGQLFSQNEVSNGFVCNLDLQKKYMPTIGVDYNSWSTVATGLGISDRTKEIFGMKKVDEYAYFANINLDCPAIRTSKQQFLNMLEKIAEQKQNN